MYLKKEKFLFCLLGLLVFTHLSFSIQREKSSLKKVLHCKKSAEISGEMVLVKGGIFKIRAFILKTNEKVSQNITINSFYAGRCEVTQKEWVLVMKYNTAGHRGNEYLPVDQVSWYEAIEFCNKKSQIEGLEKCYTIDKVNKDPNNLSRRDKFKWTVTCDFKKKGYRLPTEMEWEYMARGGTNHDSYLYSGSNDIDQTAWYEKNSGFKPHCVGTKKANSLGLFDLSGNVDEWCWDWFGGMDWLDRENPTGPNASTHRSLRGGSWLGKIRYCEVSNRGCETPECKWGPSGIRLVKTY